MSLNKVYYETIQSMEKAGVSREYINGWACGYLHNPKREVQRLNEAYEAGYEDGWNIKTDNFKTWAKK